MEGTQGYCRPKKMTWKVLKTSVSEPSMLIPSDISAKRTYSRCPLLSQKIFVQSNFEQGVTSYNSYNGG